MPALLSGANPVTVELEPGSNVVKRVDAYAIGQQPGLFYGDYTVSRIATQRGLDGTGEHLEAFLMKGNTETAYNVFEPLLQELLIAAFGAKVKIDVQLDGAEIATVHLGVKF